MGLDKSDTVMRIDVATSQTVDESQFGQTLTAADAGGYLDPSIETSLDGSGAGREISMRFTADNGDSGYMLYQGPGPAATYTFRILLSGGDVVFWYSPGFNVSLECPSISGSVETFTAHICTRPNPLTTGASDAQTTEISIYNEDQDEWAIEQFHHIVTAHTDPTDHFSYNGRWTHSTLTGDFTGTMIDVRVGSRFKSTTECAVDFSNVTISAPTTGETQADPFVAVAQDSEIGDGGNVAGPAYQFAGVQVRDTARRLVSPLANWIAPNPELQGQTHRLRTTLNSRDEVWLIQGTEPGANNPGHGDGVSGYPEVARTFDASNTECFEDTTKTPNFITDLQGGSEFTISTWVKLDSIPGQMVIAGLTGGGGASGALNDCAVLSITASGYVEFSWHNTTGSTAQSVRGLTVLGTGTWYHIAVTGTDNGGTQYDIEIFLDGVSDQTGTKPYPTHGTSSTWQVGRRDNNGTYSEYLDGSIAELKIAGSVMPDAEILDEATRQQGYLYPASELAHWQFRTPSDGYSPRRAFLTVDIGGDAYRAHLDTLIKRPVHLMTNRVEARILAGKHFTQPPGTAETADAVSIAFVATNRQPGKVTIGGPPELTVYDTQTITDDLERVEFTGLAIPRDEDGFCWFYLASRINSNSPTGHTAVTFDGGQVVPYSADLSSSFPLPWSYP